MTRGFLFGQIVEQAVQVTAVVKNKMSVRENANTNGVRSVFYLN